MKTPFSYLKKAPRLRDARKLKPDEIARKGDRFTFLSSWRGSEVRFTSVNDLLRLYRGKESYIRLGASLETSRKEWEKEHHADFPFDGVIYRPTKSSV